MTDDGRKRAGSGGNRTDDHRGPSRRRVLQGVAAAGAAGLAGCVDGVGIPGGGDGGGGDGGGGDGQRTLTEIAFTPTDCEPGTVSENIQADTTWGPQDCPRFKISGNVDVEDGATLTIEAGVEIIAESNARLDVRDGGTLEINGSVENPVWLHGESDVPGYWNGIRIRSNAPNRITNTLVTNGGSNDFANLWVDGGARVSVTNSAFERSGTYGLVVNGGDATLSSFSENAFRDNETAAASIPTTALGSLDSASTYAGNNANDRIEVYNETVTSEATWPATDAPFYFQGNHDLEAAVTVEPGASFTFASNARIDVRSGGSFAVEGGPDDPVTFEGETATPGFWNGIRIRTNNPNNSLSNAVVRHGGSNDFANLWIDGGARVSVTNSAFERSGTYGLVVNGGDATLSSFSENAFRDNEIAAASIPTTALGSLDSASTYAGNNANDRIEVYNETVTSEATWPATDAPFHLDGNHDLEAAVTVEPGASFTFASNARIDARNGGSFAAEGESGNRITFRGATESQGFWNGIRIRTNNPANVLSNVEVAHGGSNGFANLWLDGSAQATAENSTFRDSGTYGIVVNGGASLTASGNTFQNNAEGGIRNDNEG